MLCKPRIFLPRRPRWLALYALSPMQPAVLKPATAPVVAIPTPAANPFQTQFEALRRRAPAAAQRGRGCPPRPPGQALGLAARAPHRHPAGAADGFPQAHGRNGPDRNLDFAGRTQAHQQPPEKMDGPAPGGREHGPARHPLVGAGRAQGRGADYLALELPVLLGRGPADFGHRGRQRRGHQARRANAGHLGPAAKAVRRPVPARRGTAAARRQGSGHRPAQTALGPHFLHRQPRGGQDCDARRRRAPLRPHAGAGRQKPHRGGRNRRPARRGRENRVGQIPQQRPDLRGPRLPAGARKRAARPARRAEGRHRAGLQPRPARASKRPTRWPAS